jgi:hypothetical protein
MVPLIPFSCHGVLSQHGHHYYLGDINTGTWPSRLGESQMRQQNMAVSSAGLQPKSDCSGKAQKQLYSKLQTCPLVREGATK